MTRYRLVTRSDIDGLMCASLLYELDLINDILFTNARDILDGKVKITKDDIVANLPYCQEAHLCFDHHESEQIKATIKDNFIIDTFAYSASRVIFNYYGASNVFKNISWKMIKQIDEVKGMGLSFNDIKNPKEWILLGMILDSRTSLEKYVGKALENPIDDFNSFFIEHIGTLKGKKDIDQLIKHKDIIERINLLDQHKNLFEEQLSRISHIEENSVIVDFRKENTIYAGNRFVIFTTLDEEIETAIYLNNGEIQNTISIGVRQNPLEHTENKHIGLLLSKYNGGGNNIAGTCVIDTKDAEKVLNEILEALN